MQDFPDVTRLAEAVYDAIMEEVEEYGSEFLEFEEEEVGEDDPEGSVLDVSALDRRNGVAVALGISLIRSAES